MATYAKTAEVQVRLTAKAVTKEEGEALIAPVMAELFNRFGDCIFTTEEDVTLEMAVVDLLQKKHLTMATAESCTGGMIAARLVNVSGVSDVFMQGMVTSNSESTSLKRGNFSIWRCKPKLVWKWHWWSRAPRPMFVWLLPVLQVLEAVARKNR
ncbi:MAG: CinA family protein [Clostridium sp.]